MIVLGVDAALNKSGLAICRDDVVVWTGVCRVPTRKPLAEKLEALYDAVDRVIERGLESAREHGAGYELSLLRPLVLVERPGAWARGSPRSKQSTVEALAQSRAAAHMAAVNAGCPSEEIDVNEARRLIIGKVSGGPGRYTTKELVRHLLEQRGVDPELIKDPDAADAAVIALAGWSLWKAGEYD